MKSRMFIISCITISVMALTMLVYWIGLQGPFLLDDRPNIVLPFVKQTGWESFYFAITHNGSGLLGRSVSIVSLALTGIFYELDPWGYKFHNLLIHLATGLLLCRFLWRLLPALTGKAADNVTLVVAGLTAALWLLHPLFVSTVLYPVQRMTQLAAFFTLLGLLVYLEVRLAPRWGIRQWAMAWVAFPISLVLAMLSKESGALVPVFMLAMELLVFKTRFANLQENRPLMVFLGVFVAMPLLVGGLFVLTHLDALTDYSNRSFTLGERLLTELHVVFFYVRLILLPRLSLMSLYHDDFPVTSSLDLATAVLMLVLLAVLWVIWVGRHKVPVLSFGLAWFLVSHLLESTFIPLELVFEHRNYLAAAGLLLALVYSLFHVPGIQRLPLVLVPVLAGLIVMTHSRAQEWQSENMMLAIGVTDHPDSPRLLTEYASYLMEIGHAQEAINQLARVAELQPEEPGTLIHEVVFKCALEQSAPDLLAQAEARLARYPASTYTLNALGLMLDVVSKENCKALTIDDFSRLVDATFRQPKNLQIAETHGFLLRFKGMANFQNGQYAQAVIDFREGFDASGNTAILTELITYQIQIGRLDDAQDSLAALKAVNDASLGIENYQVMLLEQKLEQRRNGSTTSTPEVPVTPAI